MKSESKGNFYHADHYRITFSGIDILQISGEENAPQGIASKILFLYDYDLCIHFYLYFFSGFFNQDDLSGSLEITPYFYRNKMNDYV